MKKTIKFKLSDMLELALRELAVVKETAAKCEYSCDALCVASEKFAKKNNLPVRIFHYNDFPYHVLQLWKGFAFGTMQVNMNFSSLFEEFYQKDDEGYKTISTRKSQQARALFLTFGAMLLRENPEQDNCTYSFNQ